MLGSAFIAVASAIQAESRCGQLAPLTPPACDHSLCSVQYRSILQDKCSLSCVAGRQRFWMDLVWLVLGPRVVAGSLFFLPTGRKGDRTIGAEHPWRPRGGPMQGSGRFGSMRLEGELGVEGTSSAPVGGILGPQADRDVGARVLRGLRGSKIPVRVGGAKISSKGDADEPIRSSTTGPDERVGAGD